VELLLQYNIDLNIADNNKADKNGCIPLHYAINNGSKEIVELLLKYKADPNKADDNGLTTLHYAVNKGSKI
jgi:hypothetical protein